MRPGEAELGMNTLADQVVELTMSLVRALGRVGQFDPARPNFPRVRARLFKELTRLQRTQPEIGYVVGPPAVAGGSPELWVDGTAPQRVELRRIVGPSVGGAFILQLIELLQQRGLVALAFARGLTEPEWIAFLEIMSAPPVEKKPAAEAKRLLKALVDKRVQHVSAVADAEQPAVNAEQPWQVRVCFARLAHDLRAAVSAGAAPAVLMEQSESLVSGMAYPYFRKLDVLRPLLFQASTVDKLLSDLPALRQLRTLDLIVRGLPMFAVHGAAALILRDSGNSNDLPPEPAATVLRAVTERLLGAPSSREVDESLRTMCRRKIVAITRLPVELQEWVLAEGWVEAMRADPNREPPKGSAQSKPVRILQKGARYAFIQHMPVHATRILERIKMVDPKAVSAVFDVPTVEAVLDGFPERADERRALLALLEQGGDTAADSVASVVVAGGEAKVCEGAAWILTEMRARGIAAALRALNQDIEKEETARLLLACVSGKAPENAADVFIRHLQHKSARVRRDALSALAAACTPAADVYVAQALSDPDENVRIRALLLCANSGVGSEKVIPRAIQLVSKDARGAPPQVVRAAIEVVVRRREAGALPIADAEAALCRLATPIGIFGRLFGKKTPPAAVLVTAIAALGRLGTERAEKLLARLSRSKDPDVAQACRKGLDHKGGRVPMTPMPMVDSSVVWTNKTLSQTR
jgi:HEAT repeat protein